MTVLLFVGLVVYVFVLINKVKPLSVYQKEYYDHLSLIFGDAYDVIGNTLAIKQSTAEKYEQKKISEITKKKEEFTTNISMRLIK